MTDSTAQVEDLVGFAQRHIGPDTLETQTMLASLGLSSLSELVNQAVPAAIRQQEPLNLAAPLSEQEALAAIKAIAQKNQLYKTYIGMGYHDTFTPPVILRNVLENPGWYTAYTPYQPEVSQGRLEGLLTYQQMIIDLSGLPMANASLLDEGTAAAEAMALCKRQAKKNKFNQFFIANDVHPQTIAVVKTRAEHFGFDIVVGDVEQELAQHEVFGVLLQYPGTTGQVRDLTPIIDTAHSKDALVTVASDIMSLVLLTPPGQMGADIVVGSNQRFGVPMGMGGPHAGFFAFREEFKRLAPGRIIGVSVDKHGKQALRMAMQTREQHIRREKATSNICTSQVLLALISAFYAMYHGPDGLKTIATTIHQQTKDLAAAIAKLGFDLIHTQFFDTLEIDVGDQQDVIYQRALSHKINFRRIGNNRLGISINECTSDRDLAELLNCFGKGSLEQNQAYYLLPKELLRRDAILTHPLFNNYHNETEMMRYLRRLEARDVALNQSMIPLGSCTMKLNAAAEMIPVTWPEFGRLHPFAPIEQAAGYQQLFSDLQNMLEACTGYAAISLQPNAGSQGEYAGLVAIKKYFQSLGKHRNICLIPSSAHGTNPASAQMAGLSVVVVKCDDNGNVDLDDLQKKIDQHGNNIAALMVTYPSTHGVYEEGIRDICAMMHSVGAQVYMDGANLNALVGVAAPGEFGSDVSHLNLHKTFCIPHGGGGPGMGPIGVAKHLIPFLPGHPVQAVPECDPANGTISAAPWGSASILPISWMYIAMMGNSGMRQATEYAILNANYIAKQLDPHFPVLYRGKNGFVAHECIIDLRPLKEASGITEEDVAKRLMDFGFHAPTMSFPVAGTLMIEPTESESKAEMDKFIDAMIAIRQEIEAVINGTYSAEDNPLVNAPHTLDDILASDWTHPYSRETAVRPAAYLQEYKYWPCVNRIDNVYGDRNLMCSCPPMESYLDLPAA